MSGFLNNEDGAAQSQRLMLALAASIGVFVLYEAFFAPTPPVRPPPVAEGSSLAGDDTISATGSTAPAPVAPAGSEMAGVVAIEDQLLATDNATWRFSNAGGRLSRVTIEEPEQYVPHEDVTGIFPVAGDPMLPHGVTIVGFPDLRADSLYEFVSSESGQPRVTDEGTIWESLTYRWLSPDGSIEVRRTFEPGENPFSIEMSVDVINRGTADRRFDGLDIAVVGSFDPEARTSMFGARSSVLEAVCSDVEGTHRKPGHKVEERAFAGAVNFAGVNELYFLNAVIPRNTPTVGCRFARFDEEHVGAIVRTEPFSVGTNALSTFNFTIFTGPKDVSFIRPLDAELQDAIDLGWFSFLAIPIREVLVFFHRIVPNWGIAIIMLTMFIKLLLFPVTNKAFVSMEKMRELQPQIAALQKKYENDRMKLGEEQMKLFRESGTSPFGGCLPMILQMPIYIALYRTIQGTTELYNAPFMLWIQDLSNQDPYLILPLLMGVTMWGQNKLMPQTIDNPQMAAVQKIMPFMFTAFMLFLPSGLVLYIFVNMLLSIAQQLYIRKSLEKKRAGAAART